MTQSDQEFLSVGPVVGNYKARGRECHAGGHPCVVGAFLARFRAIFNSLEM